jgi:hypothetical protein
MCVVAIAAAMLCFVSWVGVSAQPSFELGLKFGLGLSKVTGDDTKGSEDIYMDLGDGWYAEGNMTMDFGDMKPGFVGGAYATAHVNEMFGVRLEALYFKKGGKGDNSGELLMYDEFDVLQGAIDISGENTLTLDYFEIPLLAVLSFPAGESAAFEVFAGPAIAFNTKAEFETEVTLSVPGYSETETGKVDLSDDIKGTDFGGVLGAGFTFNLTSVSLFAEARWTMGFTKVDDSADPGDIKNSAFGFMAGVGIPLAKTQ